MAGHECVDVFEPVHSLYMRTTVRLKLNAIINFASVADPELLGARRLCIFFLLSSLFL